MCVCERREGEESYGFLGIIPKSRWKEQEREKTQKIER